MFSVGGLVKEERNLTEMRRQNAQSEKPEVALTARDEENAKLKKQTQETSRYESPAYAFRPNP